MTRQMDEPSPIDREIERHWRAHSTEVPRPEIDAAIRAAARRELRQRRPWQRYAPLAAAASVGVLAFLLVRHVPRHDVTVVAPVLETTIEPAPPPAAVAESAAAPAPTAVDSSVTADSPTTAPPSPAAVEPPMAASSPAPARAPAPIPPSPAPIAEPGPLRAREAEMSASARKMDEAGIAATGAATATARSAAPSARPPPALIELVIADVMRRTGMERDDISIVSTERVAESDDTSHCAAPDGEAALPLRSSVYRITVDTGNARLEYLTDDRDRIQWCSARDAVR